MKNMYTIIWINFENIKYVKEASHKNPHIMLLHLYELSRMGKSIKTENSSVVA